MKIFTSLAALCLTVCLCGCATTSENASMASPGAVSECGANCEKPCCHDASPGAMGEKADCSSKCSGQAKECPYSGTSTSMGTMGDKPACSKSCGSK